MARDLSRSRSPSYRRSRVSRRSFRDRSRSPYSSHAHSRRQHEAELKLIEEETTRRVEEAIQKQVAGNLDTEEIKLELQRHLEEGRRRLQVEVKVQLEIEKEAALIEARRKEEQALKEKEELERKLEENKRRLEQTQRLEALEQEKKEEQRYRELEEMQRQKEEALKRKKQEEEAERAKQMKVLGKNKSRPKLSFAFNSNVVSGANWARTRR